MQITLPHNQLFIQSSQFGCSILTEVTQAMGLASRILPGENQALLACELELYQDFPLGDACQGDFWSLTAVQSLRR